MAMADGKWRAEKLVLSSEFVEWMRREGCDSVVIELPEWEEVTVIEYGGCSAVGVGGMHSEAYGEDGGCCEWCGALGPRRNE